LNKRRLIILLIFIIPAFLVISRLGKYAYPQTSIYSDLTISHLPYAEFIRSSISKFGEIPLWYPGIFGGIPLSSHPLSGLWYPLGWLGIILSGPIGFNLAFSIHMVLAGLGMFFLLKEEKVGDIAAILGGLAFELTPKLMAHWAAGHVSMCFAYSLTPWLLLSESHLSRKNSWKWVGITVIPFAFILLADIRWAAYAGISWIGFRAFELVKKENWRKSIFDWGIKTLSVVLLVCLLTAPFLLDFLEFTSLSTRSMMSTADRSRFGLPIDQLLGMIYPDFGGYAEWIFYPGAMSLLLVVLVAFARGGWKRAGFWLGLMGLSLILSMGSRWYGNIPILSLLRVPSRFLFLFDFSTTMILGFSIDALIRGDCTGIIFKSASWLAVMAVGGLAILLAIVLRFITGSLPVEMLWGLILFTISLGILFLIRYIPIQGDVIIIGLTLIIGIDLGVAGNSQLRWVAEVPAEQIELRIANSITKFQLQGRGYSPSYQVSQLTSERMNIEMISGVDPMQLERFVRYFSDATNIPVNEYSIPLPPLNEDPIGDSNRGILPDAEKLGWMNVEYMVTGERFENPVGWEHLSRVDGTYIYINLHNRPRAWVQASSEEIDSVFSEATINYYSPNKIYVTANGPGTVVLAEVSYPGWKVKIDGKNVPIGKISSLLRSVQIDAGEHQIEFSYWPHWITIGFITQLFGLILIAFIMSRKEKA
jgi:hypothetical protein